MGDTATSCPIFRIWGEVSLWDRLLLICGQKFKTFKILCLLTLWEISRLEARIWFRNNSNLYNLVTPLIHHVSLSLSPFFCWTISQKAECIVKPFRRHFSECFLRTSIHHHAITIHYQIQENSFYKSLGLCHACSNPTHYLNGALHRVFLFLHSQSN